MDVTITLSERAEQEFGRDAAAIVSALAEAEATRRWHCRRSLPRAYKEVAADGAQLLGKRLLAIYGGIRKRRGGLTQKQEEQEKAIFLAMERKDLAELNRMFASQVWMYK